jgi:hypothetical protein
MFLEYTYASVMGSSDPTNVTYPSITIAISPPRARLLVRIPTQSGRTSPLGPTVPAEGFSGHFVASFDAPFVAFGTVQNSTARASETACDGTMLGLYAIFLQEVHTVDVRIRVGISLVSIERTSIKFRMVLSTSTRP